MSSPKQRLAEALSQAAASLGATLTPDEVARTLSTPPDRTLGDLAWPAFPLAKTLRKAPPVIAAELVAALQPLLADDALFGAITAAGGYVNVLLDRDRQLRTLLTAATAEDWGRGQSGVGRTVALDYSSPNIAKPFGIGHLRSTAIGHALANLYAEQGWKVVAVNHLGDWGTQFGKLIVAWKSWGDEAALAADPIGHLYDLYVRFHKGAEDDPSLDEQGRAWFRKLEQGDDEATTMWQRFRDVSLRAFQAIYARLGVTFDHYWGEAFYNDKLDPLIAQLEASGLTRISDGALVVDVGEELPPCLIRKSDGATLYATRDLAAAIYRYEQLQFDRFLYVVGAAQSVHFRQVFAVLERMGHPAAAGCVHVPFGMILGMSTRKGTLVFLEDILERGRTQVAEILAEREYLSEDERMTIAEQVAVGAVVFYDLSRNRIKDYDFDWDLMLRGLRPGESGRTGVYLQYTHVRLQAVEAQWLERRGSLPNPTTIDVSRLSEEITLDLTRELEKFPAVLKAAVDEDEPSLLSRYLLDLAGAFNAWYSGGHRILDDDEATADARITLARAVRHTIARGLGILGVPCPARM